jgi:hypothetical protein
MNMEIQKKWFIYVGDHHEGPYSSEDLYEKKKTPTPHLAVKEESYVWCEGMVDWQMISQIPELQQDFKKLAQNDSLKNVSGKDAAFKNNSPYQRKSGKILFIIAGTAIFLFIATIATLSVLSRTSSEDFHASLRPNLNRMVDRFPILSSVFKLIPTLTDVKPEEMKELEEAITGSPDTNVKVAIALSQTDPNRPFFYLTSNLPNKTKLDVYLIGNRDTLLNKLQFNTQASATLNFGFAKTDALLAESGQPLPKGEYQVFITESAEQDDSLKEILNAYQPVKTLIKAPKEVPENAHFLFAKTYFLGGERDQTYLTRLKAFHDKVKQNAEKELMELKQYSDTLLLQFGILTQDFNKIYTAKKISNVAKSNWKKNSETWLQLNNQLEQTIQTWTKDTLQNEFFYGKVYELVKNSYDAMKKLYVLENSYVENPADKVGFDIQHGKALSEAREANEQLKTKVDLILKAPKTPSGLPTREGL